MSEEDELLSIFLSAAQEEFCEENQPPIQKKLKEIDILTQESNITAPTTSSGGNLSVIHSGDTDSSDDESNKYFESAKYNNFGKTIKSNLKSVSSNTATTSTTKSRSNGWLDNVKKGEASKDSQILTDPISGIRIINPLVSSSLLKERMIGREAVPLNCIARYIQKNGNEKDFVVAGVIVGKSNIRTSQKGSQYMIWTLSDLKDDIKTVSVFLFGDAYKELWKVTVSTVIGILNPNILDNTQKNKDLATLSVTNSQKVMIFGQSKDYGVCKSIKKNGEHCTNVVNISKCEYCVYHIKQEYDNFSRRSDLQGSIQGRGLLALQNKVLGKNEVFYAGKSFTAVPAKRSRKLETKDKSRMQLLNDSSVKPNVKVKVKAKKTYATVLHVNQAQRLRDLELLKKLEGKKDSLRESGSFEAKMSDSVTIDESKATALSVLAKLKAKKQETENTTPNNFKNDSLKSLNNIQPSNILKKDVTNLSNKIPTLSGNVSNNIIDLNVPVTPKHINKAKMNALNYVQRYGQIKKSDPNSIKSPSTKKRSLDIEICTPQPSKKAKIEDNEFLSDRFKKMMAAASKHTDLLEDFENEQQEKYFNKLEKKELMEEKMINTFKVACKAVRCLKCKYTNFSASELCKNEKHPLKVFDAMKRFFKCGDCGNRTVSLDVVPLKPCKKCGGAKWEKTGMMKEKIVKVDNGLSLRGDEETFLNSAATNKNLNLLVPE